MKNADKPAYPTQYNTKAGAINLDKFLNGPSEGLTKREMFAMAAMQGIQSNPAYNESGAWSMYDKCKTAVMMADELLKQLES